MAQSNYFKAPCDVCQKETYHYAPAIGTPYCCIHNNNLITRNVQVPTREAYIADEPKPVVKAESGAIASKKVKTSTGVHTAFCKVCERETYHYKEGTASARCWSHSEWVPGKIHHMPDSMMLMELVRKPEVPTEGEVRRMNAVDMSKWRKPNDLPGGKHYLDGMAGVFTPMPILDYDKVYCTFCHSQVERIEATSENRPDVHKIMDTYRNGAGEVVIEEKTIVTAHTVTACKKCVGNLRKPVITRVV